MYTGNKNPVVLGEDLSNSQQSTSSPLLFDSVKKIYPPLNDSSCFGTVDYDFNINTKTDYSISPVKKIYENSRTENITSYL